MCWGAILGQTVGVAIFVLVSLYPFYLQHRRPGHYKGVWKSIGDTYRTPTKALLTSIAVILGAILVTLIMIGQPIILKVVLDSIFPLALLFVGIAFGAGLLRLQRRIEQVEERLERVEKERHEDEQRNS